MKFLLNLRLCGSFWKIIAQIYFPIKTGLLLWQKSKNFKLPLILGGELTRTLKWIYTTGDCGIHICLPKRFFSRAEDCQSYSDSDPALMLHFENASKMYGGRANRGIAAEAFTELPGISSSRCLPHQFQIPEKPSNLLKNWPSLQKACGSLKYLHYQYQT